MAENVSGREPVQIVEIRQPMCANSFGVAPCAATGTDDQKCYNTRATCRDAANFALGSPLSLFFSRGNVADKVPGLSYVIPSLVSVSTQPAMINLAGGNDNAQGIGLRAVCRLVFADHPHTDRVVDPYIDGRSWDPMDRSRGSFWSRWIARNKYRQNIEIIVYEGYAGQTLAQMVRRTYFLQAISYPDASGKVAIEGKDILARIEERKAQAPLASPGVLHLDIDAAVDSFEVANATEADYPASGTLRIGDEVMTYSARAASANGLTISGVVRGTDGTAADDHSAEDTVQICLRFDNLRVDEALSLLFLGYSGIPASYLNTSAWASEVSDHLSLFRINGLVTEPTGVTELVSEIQIQSSCFIWWDERSALVNLKALRAVSGGIPLLTDADHLLAGSFAISEAPKERVSQVWVYYDMRDPTGSVKAAKNYRTVSVFADLSSEGQDLYGEPSIRKIYARFLRSSGLADTVASKVITRFVDIPARARFQLDAKDRDLWLGDAVRISHPLDVDPFGNRRVRIWTITSAEEISPGEVVEYVAEDTTLYGRIVLILPAGALDYGVDGYDEGGCFIGDAAGLLSDGSPCGRIS
ncbi:MAG: hypothetical protein IE919_09995 [Thioclava sp.]|nr:hypothetical protein [Thioclava sp.]MBD3803555.1 hypothetical protein [Thioclava sp.]